jgi:hypothetical protein
MASPEHSSIAEAAMSIDGIHVASLLICGARCRSRGPRKFHTSTGASV